MVNFCQHVLKPLLGSFTRVFIVFLSVIFFFSAAQDYASELGPQTELQRLEVTEPEIAHSSSNPMYQGTPTPDPKYNRKPTAGMQTNES